jgi:hypothetical protein
VRAAEIGRGLGFGYSGFDASGEEASPSGGIKTPLGKKRFIKFMGIGKTVREQAMKATFLLVDGQPVNPWLVEIDFAANGSPPQPVELHLGLPILIFELQQSDVNVAALSRRELPWSRRRFCGKPKAFQGFIQLGVEPTFGAGDHLIGGYPKFRLRSFLFRGEHESQTLLPTKYSTCSGNKSTDC